MRPSAGFMAVALVLSGGCASGPAPRTIRVELLGNRFKPDELKLAAGERVRFVIANRDNVDHEFVIGDEKMQAEHMPGKAEQMHHGGMSSAISVPKLETATLDFAAPSEAMTLLIGCHVADHYESGMKGRADVVAS